MAESKKLVIKINYDKNADGAQIKPPSMVTVWHTKRIALVLAMLIVLLIAIIYILGSANKSDEFRSEQSADSGGRTVTDSVAGAISNSNVSKQTKINPQSDLSPKPGHIKTEPANSEAKRSSAIIFDKAVIRASLNSSLKDNEPYEQVAGPIRLTRNQTIELFYFNELKGIKHKVFYHYWSKDGKLVYKKQLDVKSKRPKVNSTKVLSYNDRGNWQIQLVDKKGKVFSEVDFVVDSE